jgi:hypothetical protein
MTHKSVAITLSPTVTEIIEIEALCLSFQELHDLAKDAKLHQSKFLILSAMKNNDLK